MPPIFQDLVLIAQGKKPNNPELANAFDEMPTGGGKGGGSSMDYFMENMNNAIFK